MCDDEESLNIWWWNKVIELAESIDKKHPKMRSRIAKEVLRIVDKLSDAGFIAKEPERFERIYNKDGVYAKVAKYLYEEEYYIQRAAEKYFQALCQGRNQTVPELSFERKSKGIHTGVICTVSAENIATRYFVKTHQYGVKTHQYGSSSSRVGKHNPDLKELFVYKLIEFIGIGPESHFLIPAHSSTGTVYIATKEIRNLILLKDLNSEQLAERWLSWLRIEYFSTLFRLRDVHGENCGLVDRAPMIFDFHVETRDDYKYTKEQLRNCFAKGYAKFFDDPRFVGVLKAKQKDVEQREAAQKMLRQILDEWNLVENIGLAYRAVAKDFDRKQVQFQLSNDLRKYVEESQLNVQLFKACTNKL